MPTKTVEVSLPVLWLIACSYVTLLLLLGWFVVTNSYAHAEFAKADLIRAEQDVRTRARLDKLETRQETVREHMLDMERRIGMK